MTTARDAVRDQLLVLRSQRGDRAALEELIAHWEQRLFYYIRRLVADEQDAWDVLQKTWLRALKSLRTLREPRSFPTWIYRIARNTAFSHGRLRRAEAAAGDGQIDPDSIAADTDDLRREDAERVHHALGRLSLPHREVLTLHFLEALPVAEVAEIVGVPAGTVKSRLHHARRALRAVLEKEDRDHASHA